MSRHGSGSSQSHRGKIFKTGGSQAVRLPKECRLAGEEVLVRKMGSMVVLSPLPSAYSDEFREMLLGPEDTVIHRAPQGRAERRERVR
jgi:antitoxin VapB